VVLKYVVPPVLMWKAPDWIAAMPSWTNCVRQSTSRAFSARDLVVIGLVGLAEIGGIGEDPGAFLLHPQQRRAGVETA
jgi:hypothetical protein